MKNKSEIKNSARGASCNFKQIPCVLLGIPVYSILVGCRFFDKFGSLRCYGKSVDSNVDLSTL